MWAKVREDRRRLPLENCTLKQADEVWRLDDFLSKLPLCAVDVFASTELWLGSRCCVTRTLKDLEVQSSAVYSTAEMVRLYKVQGSKT